MDGRLLQKPEIQGKAKFDGITHIWKGQLPSWVTVVIAANSTQGIYLQALAENLARKENTAHITNMETTYYQIVPTHTKIPHKAISGTF